MQNHINTIFFDLFGVLIGFDQSVVVQYLSKLTNTPYLKAREIAMGEPYMQLERGEIKFQEYVKNIVTLLPNGDRVDTDKLRAIWMNSTVDEMPVVSLLHELQKIYSVWVISNTTESHINSLQSQFVFLRSFNGIITSEGAGVHKPHPNIFKFALEQANTDATSSIFIDDSFNNVQSAENLGIVSHHYKTFDELVKFLEKGQKI